MEKRHNINKGKEEEVLVFYCLVLYIALAFLLCFNLKVLYECKEENYIELNNKCISLKNRNDKIREEMSWMKQDTNRYRTTVYQILDMTGALH